MRSHQLKMVKKVIEERRRRKEGGVRKGSSAGSPLEQARSRASSQRSGERIEKEGRGGP